MQWNAIVMGWISIPVGFKPSSHDPKFGHHPLGHPGTTKEGKHQVFFEESNEILKREAIQLSFKQENKLDFFTV